MIHISQWSFRGNFRYYNSLVHYVIGYWRQQLDHICLHLKAYTQGCPDFQAAVGKPQMGKVHHTCPPVTTSYVKLQLLSATLHDEDTELKVHLTYQLKPR